ncbi:MAG: class I SAM-dependent methyltransferase [Raineya sp.]|nr:class I SAM-dependent methyltransferase [Raineya sp.]
MLLLTPTHWQEYQLIDSGNFEKLERFGKYIVARPEPQAVWDKSLSEKEWQKMAHATFARAKNTDKHSERGEWKLKNGVKEPWWINYAYQGVKITMKLGFTSFKHVGIFPEQAENWNFIIDFFQQKKLAQPQVLNLFAYTGGASLVARAMGAEVTHVDSVKQVLTWSRENMEASRLNNIRWICEDALKFVRREVKRGKKYNGIILDPPAYGRGANGEKWILEDNINEMMKLCQALLAEKDSFLVLNLYSMGFSALIAETLLQNIFGNSFVRHEIGELFLQDLHEKKLPLGVFWRGIR